MTPDVERIEIRHEGGGVSRMQIVVVAKRTGFDAGTADRHGFVLNTDGRWERALSDQMIEAEIARTKFSADLGKVVGWSRA